MSLFARLRGIVGSIFQIGGPTGPNWKANSGVIEARNAADSAYAIVRGATPVASNDLVTLAALSSALPQTDSTIFIENLDPAVTSLLNQTLKDIASGATFVVSDADALTMFTDRADYVIGAGAAWAIGLYYYNSAGTLVGFPASAFLFVDVAAHVKFTVTWDDVGFPRPYTFPAGARLAYVIAPAGGPPNNLVQFNVSLKGQNR